MKRLLFLFCAISLSLGICAQTLKGTVTDEKSNPIAFANVVLLSANDSSFIAGTVAKEDGTFSIDSDTDGIIIKISSVGYKTRYVNTDDGLDRIVLAEDSKMLKEVIVEKLRPAITFKDGRFIVDIANSALANGNTAESLIPYLPGVWMNGDMVSINGISGANIMVNGKTLKLRGDALVNYLKNLKSERIERIEIVANPSAEFDAGGAGGILKIVLKEREQGLAVAAASSFNVTNYEAVSPYLYASYGNQKFGADVSFAGTLGKGVLKDETFTQDHATERKLADWSEDIIKDKSYMLNANIYYEPDKRNRFAMYADFNSFIKKEDMDMQTTIDGDMTSSTRRTDTWHREKQTMNAYNLSFNYRHAFDEKARHNLLVMADLTNQYKYDIEDAYRYYGYDRDGNPLSTETEAYDQVMPYKILSMEARYDGNLGNVGSLTGGVKYSSSDMNNTLDYAEALNADMEGYEFQYTEKLLALYAKYSLGRKKWNLSVGLRGEYDKAASEGYDKAVSDFDLFPSVYYGYNIAEKHKVALSYNRRTSRVRYFTLMPRRYNQSKYSRLEGNPELKSDYINNISATYIIANTYVFTLTHVWSDNGLSSFMKSDGEGEDAMLVQTYVDGMKRRMTNLNVYVPVTITKWWSMVNQAQICDNRFETVDAKVHDFNWNVYTQQTFKLPLDIRCVLLYRYNSSTKSAYERYGDYHTLNLSLSKSMLNNKLYLSLSVNKILCGQKLASYINTEDIYKKSEMYSKELPYIGMSVYYTFSKGKKKNFKQVEKSNEQEKARAF